VSRFQNSPAAFASVFHAKSAKVSQSPQWGESRQDARTAKAQREFGRNFEIGSGKYRGTCRWDDVLPEAPAGETGSMLELRSRRGQECPRYGRAEPHDASPSTAPTPGPAKATGSMLELRSRRGQECPRYGRAEPHDASPSTAPTPGPAKATGRRHTKSEIRHPESEIATARCPSRPATARGSRDRTGPSSLPACHPGRLRRPGRSLREGSKANRNRESAQDRGR